MRFLTFEPVNPALNTQLALLLAPPPGTTWEVSLVSFRFNNLGGAASLDVRTQLLMPGGRVMWCAGYNDGVQPAAVVQFTAAIGMPQTTGGLGVSNGQTVNMCIARAQYWQDCTLRINTDVAAFQIDNIVIRVLERPLDPKQRS